MTDQTTDQTPLRCNAATMHRLGNLATAHGPHLWVMQPGMEPVHCPGTEESATAAPAETARDCPACDAGIDHSEHCPTPETHNWGCGCHTEPATETHPPAAAGLPAGTLEAAEIGANRLDAWARSPQGRNFLAHALVQLARTGWLRTEPGEPFEPMRQDVPTAEPVTPKRPPMDPVHILGIDADEGPAAEAQP